MCECPSSAWGCVVRKEVVDGYWGSAVRTETEVIQGLSPEEQALLKRVLEIERARVHITGSDNAAVDELYEAVKGIVP